MAPAPTFGKTIFLILAIRFVYTRLNALRHHGADPGELIHLSGGHCLADQARKRMKTCKPDSRLQCDRIATALAMVSAGMRVTIVPKLASRDIIHPNIVCRASASEEIHRAIHLMKRRNAKLTPAAEKLPATLFLSDSEAVK